MGRLEDWNTSHCQGRARVTYEPKARSPGIRKSLRVEKVTLMYPLCFLSSHLPSPPLSQLKQVILPEIAGLIERCNSCDKIAAIAGLLPLSLRSLLALYRPMTYKQDFDNLRLLVLVLCTQRYELFRRLSYKHYQLDRKLWSVGGT